MNRTAGTTTARMTRLTIVAGIALISSAQTYGADYYWSPIISLGGEYNDNPGLSSRTDAIDSVTGTLGEAALRLGYVGQTSQGWIEPKARFRRYSGEDVLNSDDQFVNARLDGEGEFTRWGLRAKWTHEKIRTAELDPASLDPDEPDTPTDDAGVVSIRARRDRVELHPYLEWTLSEVSSIRARVDFVDTSYDNNAENLVDFTDTRGELTYARAISDVTDWLLVGGAGDYSSDRSDRDSTGYGLRTGFERDLTQTTKLRALAGFATTDPDAGSSQSDAVGEVFLTRRLETTWLRAGYRRAISGSGLGVSVRDEIQVGFRRDLTQLISAGLGVRAYSTSALTQQATERDYAQVRAEFTWRLSQSLFLTGDYRFTFLDREDDPETADSNQIFVFLTWAPPTPSR